jgi:hypothetical protein
VGKIYGGGAGQFDGAAAILEGTQGGTEAWGTTSGTSQFGLDIHGSTDVCGQPGCGSAGGNFWGAVTQTANGGSTAHSMGGPQAAVAGNANTGVAGELTGFISAYQVPVQMPGS